MHRVISIAGLVVILSALAAAAPPSTGAAAVSSSSTDAPLRAYVSPRIGREPAKLRVQAVVEPNAQNRTLEITIDSETYYRSSEVELTGEGAARVHVAEFRGVPAGTHAVRVALLTSTRGVRALVNDWVMVVE
jgi:hypothetical protein